MTRPSVRRRRPGTPGRRAREFAAGSGLIVAATLLPISAQALFLYDEITAPIVSATLSIDAAEWTAHRTILGIEVNEAFLIDVSGGLGMLDLSDAFFGTTEALSDAALIDQAAKETGLASAAIPASFFPALSGGSVGFWLTLTDTDDGLFALDALVLSVSTASETTTALFGAPVGNPNDGFGLGIADGADLPSPLPGALTATGTGFDEAISGKSLHEVPQPGSLWLVGAGLIALALRRR